MTIQHALQNIRTNWQSALSVALVSVPLSLSLGIASGAGPVVGIVTAVWAGLIAGIVGGSASYVRAISALTIDGGPGPVSTDVAFPTSLSVAVLAAFNLTLVRV